MIETNWRGNDIQKLQYGQVQSFWVCHAPASIWTPTPQIFILALLAPCTLTEGRDAQDEVVTFKNLNATYFVDVQTIEAVVGRVRTAKQKYEWGIIDRSRAYASTVLYDVNLQD